MKAEETSQGLITPTIEEGITLTYVATKISVMKQVDSSKLVILCNSDCNYERTAPASAFDPANDENGP